MTRSSGDALSNSLQQRTVLLATDHKNSVLTEIVPGTSNRLAYSAYGHQTAQHDVMTRIGFNGELREAKLGWYFLGNGYRVYNPVLMRFHCPDSWSPFGSGGLNAYMYCGGEPVSFSDPSGHMGLFKLLTRSSGRVARSPSTSSLTPLISNTPRVPSAATPVSARAKEMTMGVTNRDFIDKVPTPMPGYENISTITGMGHKQVKTQNSITPRPGNKVPPPIPARQQPRFNDTGGQAGIISPNWKEGEAFRYREIWKSKPFEVPPAPVPPTRALPDGSTRHYYVRYDANGNPRQSSVQKAYLSEIQMDVRNTQN